MVASGRVTIRDVARAAGVSTTTVSDALSGRGRLPAGTRERVAAVARELGYAVNPGARNLRRGRTGAIGLYVPDHTLSLQYYMELAVGAAEEAMTHELALTLVPSVREPARSLRLHVDGVVISDPAVGDRMLAALSSLGVPVVTVERDLTPGADHAGRVETDLGAGLDELLAHLTDRGARTVGLICPGPETAFGHDVGAAYRRWCQRSGRPPLLREVPLACQPEEVARVVRELLRGPRVPDAVVAVPDGCAPSALQAALGEGRRVPDDLLVAAYTDSPSLRALAPPVTAVDLAPRDMGRRAARLLADLVAGSLPPGHVEPHPAHLVVRASTDRR
jgi:DNA-binding LacI/PurR family transcriptional regulator